jgi:hypothetical protein
MERLRQLGGIIKLLDDVILVGFALTTGLLVKPVAKRFACG